MKVSKKAVVLLSGGLDSTVNLFDSVKHGYNIVLALTFNYGQKAAAQEIASSKKLCEYLKVPHKVIDLPWFKDFNKSSLLVSDQEIPTGSQVSIDDKVVSEETKKSVWVPNRNGIFINIAAGFAESLGAEVVIPGFNAEEAATFPDNTKEFMDKATQSLSYSTSNKVSVGCFTVHLTKPDMVRLGQGLRIPWQMTWPCYLTGEKWCGECESCQRAKRAFAKAQVNIAHLFEK